MFLFSYWLKCHWVNNGFVLLMFRKKDNKFQWISITFTCCLGQNSVHLMAVPLLLFVVLLHLWKEKHNTFLDMFSTQNQILLLYLLSGKKVTVKKVTSRFSKRNQLKSHFKAKSLLYGISEILDELLIQYLFCLKSRRSLLITLRLFTHL